MVELHILHYWKMRKTDKQIVELLNTKHIDISRPTCFRELHESMGLFRARKQAHNKWKYKFGLALHSCLEPFVGYIQWLKIWWTNSNPRLILSYHLDTVEESGYMPLVSQSDPGLQHRWMNKKKNTHRLEQWLVQSEQFAASIIPIVLFFDGSSSHGFKRSLTCIGIGSITLQNVRIVIRYFPTEFPTICTKHRRIMIRVNPTAIAEVRNLYAPPDHDVFELVPRDFAIIVGQIYQQLGQPLRCRSFFRLSDTQIPPLFKMTKKELANVIVPALEHWLARVGREEVPGE
ncbi:hypothetical protein B0H13DRAFT_1850502 [Mycena leptocephala]|nr:hypothetical protein B0H13DRAFT_1850502 [Mycena leptocephala]